MEAQGGGLRLNWTKKCPCSGDMNFETGRYQMEVGMTGRYQMEVGMNCKLLGATEVGIQNQPEKLE